MKLSTLALHAGFKKDPTTNAVAVPIYQTTSYAFDSAQHGADLFDLAVPGNIYTRIMNPTTDVLEQRVAALEGGIAALAVASGASAITYAIQTIAEVGDNIIATSELYGGTYNLFAHTFPRQGINVKFFNKDDFQALEALIDNRTKAIFAETIGNPSGGIADIQKLSEIAHRHGIPLIVDNTVASPLLWRPIEDGADIVVHSATKYIGGHGTSLGGVIVDSGKFPWAEHAERFPLLNKADPSYHGVVYTEAFGPAAFIGRARVVPLRNTGAALSPFNAFQLIQGLETLPLRIRYIAQNTLQIAQWLKAQPQVAWVKYAGLPEHKDYALAQKYLDGKPSGILSFGLNGGREQTRTFYDALELFLRLVNIGDSKSLAAIPADTTHRQLNDEELAAAGIPVGTVRLSIGIEDPEDLIADLQQALNKALPA